MFEIYRYGGLVYQVFLINFGVVWYGGMEKWYGRCLISLVGFDSSWLLHRVKSVDPPATGRTRIGRNSSHGSAARLPPTPRHVMSASALGEVFTDIPH